MEAKKITTEQMERLFAFTRQHFVEYYDLQAELADHLANAVESRWEQHPGLTFDEALQAEFKKFGIFGFSDIVEQRQNALFKRYYKLIWREFRSVLTLNTLALLAIGAIAVYYALVIIPLSCAMLLLSFFVVSFVKLWKLRKQYKKQLEQSGKRWLLEEIIFSCGGIGIMFSISVQLIQHSLKVSFSPPLAAIMAGLFMLLFVYNYIALFRMPSRAEIYLRKVYPEYGIEN